MKNSIVINWLNSYLDSISVPWDTLLASIIIASSIVLWINLSRRQVQMPAMVAVESLEAELEFIDVMMRSYLPLFDRDSSWLVERNLGIAREQLRLASESLRLERWTHCIERAEHGMVQVCMLRRTLGLKHQL